MNTHARPSTRSRFRWLALALAIIMVVAACTADTTDVAPEQDAPEQDAPEQDAPEQDAPEQDVDETTQPPAAMVEFEIVGFLDYSGPFAARGPLVEGIHRLLIDWWNEEAGADLNVRITYLPLDSRYDAGVTGELYDRLLADKPIAIVTHGSPNVLALHERVIGDEIPVVHGGPSYAFMEGPGGWVFTPIGNYARYYAAVVEFFRQQAPDGAQTTVAYVTFDGTSGRDWGTGLNKYVNAHDDVDLVLEEYVPAGATEVSESIRRIIDADPDVVILSTHDGLQPLLLRGLNEAGFPPERIVNAQYQSLDLLQQLGVEDDVLEGTLEVTSWDYTDLTTPAYQMFAERQDEFDTRWTSGDVLLHFPSMLTLLLSIGRAIAKHGAADVTSADVFAELDAGIFTEEDLLGFMGTVEFDPQDRGAGATEVMLLQMRNGVIQPFGDGELLELPDL